MANFITFTLFAYFIYSHKLFNSFYKHLNHFFNYTSEPTRPSLNHNNADNTLQTQVWAQEHSEFYIDINSFTETEFNDIYNNFIIHPHFDFRAHIYYYHIRYPPIICINIDEHIYRSSPFKWSVNPLSQDRIKTLAHKFQLEKFTLQNEFWNCPSDEKYLNFQRLPLTTFFLCYFPLTDTLYGDLSRFLRNIDKTRIYQPILNELRLSKLQILQNHFSHRHLPDHNQIEWNRAKQLPFVALNNFHSAFINQLATKQITESFWAFLTISNFHYPLAADEQFY